MSFIKKLFKRQKSFESESQSEGNEIHVSANQSKKGEDLKNKMSSFSKAFPNIANESLEISAAKVSREGEVYLDVCKLLLESGADPNNYITVPPIFSIVFLTNTPYSQIIDQSKVYELVKLLLLKGANPNVSLENGMGKKGDPLGIAISGEAESIALLLLNNGADPQFTRNNFGTDSQYALRRFEDFLEKHKESFTSCPPVQPIESTKQKDSSGEIVMLKSILHNTMNGEEFKNSIKTLGFKYEEESVMGLMMQSEYGRILLKIKPSIHPSNIATLLYLDKKTEKETYLVEDGIRC